MSSLGVPAEMGSEGQAATPLLRVRGSRRRAGADEPRPQPEKCPPQSLSGLCFRLAELEEPVLLLATLCGWVPRMVVATSTITEQFLFVQRFIPLQNTFAS